MKSSFVRIEINFKHTNTVWSYEICCFLLFKHHSIVEKCPVIMPVIYFFYLYMLELSLGFTKYYPLIMVGFKNRRVK